MSTKIKKCAVLGAGVMGAQIAGHISNAGVPSLLFDIDEELAKKGVDTLTSLKPAPLFSKKNVSLITACTYNNDLEKLSDCDLIIEAVAEKIEIKHDVYKKLLPHLKKDAILTSNTSGIPLANLVEVLPDDIQERFLITHFFNPPRYLKLLELVKGDKTSDDIYDAVADFGETVLGKGIVHAKDTPGFIGNRLINANGRLVLEKALSFFAKLKLFIPSFASLTLASAKFFVSFSDNNTIKSSPAFEAPLIPKISTGAEGSAKSKFFPLSLIIALTLPHFFPLTK